VLSGSSSLSTMSIALLTAMSSLSRIMLARSYMLLSANPTATEGDCPLPGERPLCGEAEKRPLLVRPPPVPLNLLPDGSGSVDILSYLNNF